MVTSTGEYDHDLEVQLYSFELHHTVNNCSMEQIASCSQLAPGNETREKMTGVAAGLMSNLYLSVQ